MEQVGVDEKDRIAHEILGRTQTRHQFQRPKPEENDAQRDAHHGEPIARHPGSHALIEAIDAGGEGQLVQQTIFQR